MCIRDSFDRDYTSPLLDSILRESLVRINHDLPVEAIDEALAKLKNFDTGSLLQKNIIFMDYLQNGITVKFFVKGEEQSSIVRLIDYPLSLLHIWAIGYELNK